MKDLGECMMALADALGREVVPNQSIPTNFVMSLELQFKDGDKYLLDMSIEKKEDDGQV